MGNYVGEKWPTPKDVVASFSTDDWLAFVPTHGEVITCPHKLTSTTTTTISTRAAFMGCQYWPYATSEGVLTFSECQKRSEEKGLTYFGLNWGNHAVSNQ